MTTNTDAVDNAVAAFNSLSTDERLAALALIYSKVAGSIPSEAISGISAEASGLVSQVEKLSPERQVDALRDLLPASKNDQDEITLDANPSKALTELVSGGNTVPTGEYGSLKTEGKLAFWYQVGQKLGSSFVAIPNDFKPSSSVTQLLQSLGSLDTEQQKSFLTQVL